MIRLLPVLTLFLGVACSVTPPRTLIERGIAISAVENSIAEKQYGVAVDKANAGLEIPVEARLPDRIETAERDKITLRLLRADANLGRDQLDGIDKELADLRRLAPDEPAVIFLMARVSSRRGEPNEAVDLLLSLVGPSPKVLAKQRAVSAGIGDAYFGGGDFSVGVPEEWQQQHVRKLKMVTDQILAVLRENPGSPAALHGLLNMQRRGYISEQTKTIIEMQMTLIGYPEEAAAPALSYLTNLNE